ncbi:MAG: hypothetical protein ACXWP5_05615 [Bdellovibrionota bacterium]
MIQVDIHNLVGPHAAGAVSPGQMASRLELANQIWEQCEIQFVARTRRNVSTERLKIPFEPRSQEDLSKIAEAINPRGFHRAIPLTFAGRWGFFDSGSGLFLTGLGWAFWNDTKLERIGAVVDERRIFANDAGALIAHELAHALSLPHIPGKNLMGSGAPVLTPEQCEQARKFTETVIPDFMVKPRKDALQLSKL